MFPYPLVVKCGNGKSPSSNSFPITAPTPIQKGFRIAMFDYGMVNVFVFCALSPNLQPSPSQFHANKNHNLFQLNLLIVDSTTINQAVKSNMLTMSHGGKEKTTSGLLVLTHPKSIIEQSQSVVPFVWLKNNK